MTLASHGILFRDSVRQLMARIAHDASIFLSISGELEEDNLVFVVSKHQQGFNGEACTAVGGLVSISQ